MKPTDELSYRGLHLCDSCGGPLANGEGIVGVCRACRANATRRRRERDRSARQNAPRTRQEAREHGS
jgi:hypothetical protein